MVDAPVAFTLTCFGDCCDAHAHAQIVGASATPGRKIVLISLSPTSMYRDPDEVETKQPTVKTDPTAPARSAIRRQRTVRYSPNTRQPSFNTISSTNHRPGGSHGRTRAASDRRSMLEDIRRREGALTNTLQQTATEVANLEATLHEYPSARVSADIALNRASQRSRRESGRAFLRDALSYERPNERVRIGRDTTVPEAPETVGARHLGPDGPVVDATDQLGEEVSLRRQRRPWPTQPYSFSGDSLENSPVHRSMPPLDTASLTPRFAPAHRLSNETAGENIVGEQTLEGRLDYLVQLAQRIPSQREVLHEEDRIFFNSLTREIELMVARPPDMVTAPYLLQEAAYLRNAATRLSLFSANGSAETTSTDLDDLPSLHRMDQHHQNAARRAAARRQFHRSQRARARQDTLDGLGDRQRSFSPDDDANDTWETMLTTITPDERVPSAHSSFTTATASASASATSRSSNNSATSSYGTLVTVPSTHTHTDIEVCPAEEESSASDNDDQDEEEEEIFDFTTEEDWSVGGTATPHHHHHHHHHHQRFTTASGADRATIEAVRGPIRGVRRVARAGGSGGGVAASEEEWRRLESTVQRLTRELAEERAAGRSWGVERL